MRKKTLKKENLVIILIGKTHSGKTTLARAVSKGVKNCCVLETDPFALFIQENIPQLKNLEDKEHTGAFHDIALKFLLFETTFQYMARHRFPIILANSNMWKEVRVRVLRIARKYKRYTVGVWLDFADDELLRRVQGSARDTRVLRTTKSFQDLVKKQKHRFQVPVSSEFDELFEVRTNDELTAVTKKLRTLIS